MLSVGPLGDSFPTGAAGKPSAPIFLVRCQYCSKQRRPNEVSYYPGGVIRCWHCEEWHARAIDLLAYGTVPETCQGCNTPTRGLPDDGEGNVELYLHPKDGVYQILCRTCSDRYVRQRVDLYGATEFGSELKL